MNIIPLINSVTDQEFSVQLGNNNLAFRVRWLTRYSYFVVDIRDADNNPIALGRALHVGINLLAGLNTRIGKIVLEGETPTLANLGEKNNLVWYPS
ncbi:MULTISPECIES: phage baseplate plug family protein [Brenneria]|uniref:Cyanophage baseplate Pam3 plug gp18 domain-containing protein n=1 Tax=Brenneria nigrifluens DSM 30175 = ATCC 13028 TaxID=1121120 RepID=A0A2U1UTX8_9GAMM|nr:MULTISPECIES: hypothetical protein [Brenneria]EHD21773.1 hypothetical protein BrE312_2393 [Brenneria sp. EniD312]PWC25126.1 hypothetical protein DDT54_04285 [Brenneria nigrifluens DSM 30175 = ATCC 13028]QCR04883.1 hypothetical protein EH206_12250 [Brenneria nigrifluens DSM 30175 = ATCC 13028]